MDVLKSKTGSAQFTRREHLERYRFDAEKFDQIADLLHKKIRAYDPEGGYGVKLSQHLERTSQALGAFMRDQGYDADSCRKVTNAFYLHDLGKIAQDIQLWGFTEEKPDEQKRSARLNHVDLGEDILMQFLKDKNIELTRDDKMHVQTIVGFMENHHERLDGSGPKGLRDHEMPEILRMATIADTYDGKAMKPGRESQASIDEMETGKNAAQFDTGLVQNFRNLVFSQPKIPLPRPPVPTHQ